MLVLEALAIAVVLVAAVTDLLEHKIYNVLTGPAMLVGVLGWLATGPWWEGFAAAIAVGAPFFALYAFDVLKAGDVKLLMAIGALLGLKLGIMAGLMSVMAFFPIGVTILLLNRNFANLRRVFTRGHKPLLAPFGGSIAVGTLLALWYAER